MRKLFFVITIVAFTAAGYAHQNDKKECTNKTEAKCEKKDSKCSSICKDGKQSKAMGEKGSAYSDSTKKAK